MAALISLAGEIRGESGLQYLPAIGERVDDELLLHAKGMTGVDAWLGVAMRARIEYHARYFQRPVCIVAPDDRRTWRLLASLVGELPAQVSLARGDEWPPGRAQAALLPAQRLEGLGLVDQLADFLPSYLARNYPRTEARFLAAAFKTLAENSHLHARDSPIGAIAAILYDGRDHALQLVVVDLGQSVARVASAEQALEEIQARSASGGGGLVELTRVARRRNLDLELTVAAGSGRLHWSAGTDRWSTETTWAVQGFAVGAIARL
jgi:hypothetical protein